MIKVILDTNAIMAIAEFKIDLFTELQKTCTFPYTTYVLAGTITELQNIQQEQRGKYKAAAKLGLALLDKMDITIVESSNQVDDELVAHAKSGDLVLTQDAELKRRLKKPYLTIRQKKRIIIVE